jgi:hypothetical protein
MLAVPGRSLLGSEESPLDMRPGFLDDGRRPWPCDSPMSRMNAFPRGKILVKHPGTARAIAQDGDPRIARRLERDRWPAPRQDLP